MADSSVAPSGGDFTSLSAALADAGTGSGDTITISGDWTSTTDTTSCTVADDNITIVTSGSARHAGFDNEGSNYELAVTDGATAAIQVNNTGCKIDGLLIHQNASGVSDEGIRFTASGGTLRVVNSVLRGNGIEDQDGLYAGAISCTVETENVVVYGFGRAGFHAQMHDSGTDAQTWNGISNTIRDCGTAGGGGEQENAGVEARTFAAASTYAGNFHNCISVENTDNLSEDFKNSGTGQSGTNTWNIDNCISSDASITGLDSGAVNAHESVTVVEGNPASGELGFIDITSAPFDLRLFDDAADNVAQDDHTNATGAGLTIGDYTTGDIAGTSRPQNTNYDIGAFEVVSGAGPTGRIMSSLVASGGLAGAGGIAGVGGGLAG